MNSNENIWNNSKIIFVNRPVHGHSWFMIRKGDLSYLFYDENRITSGLNSAKYFKGSRSKVSAAVEMWQNMEG